ncbi:hypothetical protein UFOVP703_14 [uncultured Caudovirales phage]|uniref:Uncharacterized protein n=1 Tax=uncultured Caudovirales phage TaxID=2100421 RepID=A0A6J5NFJ7_9CAUD|nr:hypothetical protein UFOVP703_14 [uncultured Caudovirales phage]
MSTRPITDTLRLLQGGLFLDQCSDLFANVVRSVDDTGKTGKLTITLDVKKVSGAISVTAKVTDKAPEKAPDADLFYATVEGNLSRNNPNQRELELRVAEPAQKPAPRSVDEPKPEARSAG